MYVRADAAGDAHFVTVGLSKESACRPFKNPKKLNSVQLSGSQMLDSVDSKKQHGIYTDAKTPNANRVAKCRSISRSLGRLPKDVRKGIPHELSLMQDTLFRENLKFRNIEEVDSDPEKHKENCLTHHALQSLVWQQHPFQILLVSVKVGTGFFLVYHMTA